MSRGGGVRVLGVAVIPKHVRAVEASLREAAALGGGGVYLTTQPVGRTLPDSIEVVDISAMERTSPALPTGTGLGAARPGLVLRILHRSARLADGVAAVGLPPALPSALAGARCPAGSAGRDRHRPLARSSVGPYAAFCGSRSLYVPGGWRRRHSAGRRPRRFRRLVVSDDHMVPVAVRVLRIRPELEVQRRWTPATIARTYAERSRRVPTGASRPGPAR